MEWLTVDQVLELPAEVRRNGNYGLNVKRQGAKRSTIQRERWRAMPGRLERWLKENNVKSAYRLRQMRKEARKQGKVCQLPTVQDVCDILGSGTWHSAMVAVWGTQIPEIPNAVTARYIVNCIVAGDLWTKKRFLDARRRDKRIPSLNQIRKHFRSFGQAVWCARNSTKWPLEQWLELALSLNRMPQTHEIHGAGINIPDIRKCCDNRAELNDFLRRLFRIAKTHRNTSRNSP